MTMPCPWCEADIEVGDWGNGKPFHCSECGQAVQLTVDEVTREDGAPLRLVAYDGGF